MRSGDAGFSLIESLVALAILAVTAVSLLLATEAHVGRIDGLEARALARFAAENRLAELEGGLGGGPDAGDDRVEVLGRRFAVRETRTPTADPGLDRVDIDVTDLDASVTFGGFVGFVAAEAAP